MVGICKLSVLFVACAMASSAQTAQSDAQMEDRDLRLKKELETRPAIDSQKLAIPRGYALIIGISRYRNLAEKFQLKYPEADAADMYTTFINPESGRFAAENVHRLLGPAATFANIRHELEDWLPSVSKPDDRVIIYFAGHGFVSAEGKAYLAPYDVDGDDIPGTAYSMDRLSEVFGARIHAKWRVLLTDACHSGAILPAADPEAINNRLKDFNPSVFSLTASRESERSLEGPGWGGGHGVFTQFVKQGLEGEADANRDGWVTADELAEYVHSNVRRETETHQNPTSERGNFDPNMLLAYNPTRVHAFVPEAPTFGTLVLETNLDDVEVFLDDKSQGVISKQKPLKLDGIRPGVHKIEGVHMGYEPYGPEEETVYPGQPTTVTVRITVPRHKNKAAIDLLDKGLIFYANGGEKNYRHAAELFEEALRLDPKYSRAALCLGRTYNALSDLQKANKYFEQAINIDLDYLEARDSYAGSLLDQGSFQSAVRQLNASIQRDPRDGFAHYLMCVAFTRLGAVDKNADILKQAIEEGRQSVQLIPGKAEAHFWLAESLRMANEWNPAETEYNQYLKLSNFDSGVTGKVNYYLVGYLIGLGKKTRPTLPDIWRAQRSLAYFGLCDCERNLRNYDGAINFCQRALTFDPEDPFAHYALGISYLGKFHSTPDPGLLVAARNHFNSVITLHPEMEEASVAKNDVKKIDTVLLRSQ
jgi:tetratricopeptide (TPR) repeat protein